MGKITELLFGLLAPRGVLMLHPALRSQSLVRGYGESPISHSLLVPGTLGRHTPIRLPSTNKRFSDHPSAEGHSPWGCVASAYRQNPQGSGEGACGSAAIASVDYSCRGSKFSSAAAGLKTATGLEVSSRGLRHVRLRHPTPIRRFGGSSSTFPACSGKPVIQAA
jgi:hypothetical protein